MASLPRSTVAALISLCYQLNALGCSFHTLVFQTRRMHNARTNWLGVCLLAVVTLVSLPDPVVAAPASKQQGPQKLYRYRDAKGMVVIDDAVPPQFARNGYEVLNSSGQVIEVVPPERVATGPGILVCYDGTQASIRAIRALARSGIAQSRPVHVLTVGDSGEKAWMVAGQGAALLDEVGITATPRHIVSVQTTTETLLEQRAKLDVGLVVMGAYAHSRFSRLLWGSVTKEMLEQSVVPMFLHY